MSSDTIIDPRAIIDRKALTKKLDDLAGWSGYTPSSQGEVLGIFKDAHRQGWDENQAPLRGGRMQWPGGDPSSCLHDGSADPCGL